MKAPGFSRRGFLAGTVTAGVSLGLPRPARAAPAPAPPANLAEIARQGLATRLGRLQMRTTYVDRLEMELDVIRRLEVEEPFRLAHAATSWARHQEIPVGPGRGAATSSLVAWALKITDVDPVQHGLIFERFLNPRRPSQPNFDLEFCAARRDDVIDFLLERYSGRAALVKPRGNPARDALHAAMLSDIDVGDQCRLVDRIPEPVGGQQPSLGILIDKDPVLTRARAADPDVARWFELAIWYEQQLPQWSGVDSELAGSLAFASGPITDHGSIFRNAADRPVIALERVGAERAGLVVLDCLRMQTLTVIERVGVPLGEPDADIFEMLAAGETDGVFHLEDEDLQDYLRAVEPSSFEHVIAVAALWRAGPLESGLAEEYVLRRHGKKRGVVVPVPAALLRETYGLIVYQEQIMRIANVVAGFDFGRADLFRRALGRNRPEELDAYRLRFSVGAAQRGHARCYADELFDILLHFTSYTFLRAHAVADATVTMKTAWLKRHAPDRFAAARNEIGLTRFPPSKRTSDQRVESPDLDRSADDGDHYLAAARLPSRW